MRSEQVIMTLCSAPQTEKREIMWLVQDSYCLLSLAQSTMIFMSGDVEFLRPLEKDWGLFLLRLTRVLFCFPGLDFFCKNKVTVINSSWSASAQLCFVTITTMSSRCLFYSFNLFTIKDIVEDGVTMILRPFKDKDEASLLYQNLNSGILDVYSAHIWLRFMQCNEKACGNSCGG